MTERDMMATPAYEAVIEQPMNDRPRIELARTLDAKWPDRAAFTRLQLLQHRWSYLVPPYQWPDGVLKLSLELKKRLDPCWRVSPPLHFTLQKHESWSYDRGFVETVKLTAARIGSELPDVMKNFPIMYLTLIACSAEDLRRLAAMPSIARLLFLRVHAPDVGDDGIRTLLESPYLENLKHLTIENAALTMNGYEMVAKASKTTLRGLEAGFLKGNTIPDPQEREPSYDSSSGARIHETVSVLPLTGQILEENFGYQKWLHWTNRFPRDFTSLMFERPLDMDETPLSLADVGVE